MNKSLKFVVYVVVALAVVALASGYESVGISDRQIILGVALDYDDQSQTYALCVESVAPGGQNGQAGSFLKMLSANGDTVEEAFAELCRQTGTLTSLGQCQTLVLGESLYAAHSVRHALSFFSAATEFRDNAALLFAEGSAASLFVSQMPLSKSVSLTLAELLSSGNESGVSPGSVGEFLKGQVSANSSCGNVVKKMSQPPSPLSDEYPSAVYDCSRIALFRDFRCVSVLDELQSKGYFLLKEGTVGQTFSVHDEGVADYESPKTTLGVCDKSVQTDVFEDLSCSFKLTLTLLSSRSVKVGQRGDLFPEEKDVFSQEALDSAASQAKDCVEKFLTAAKSADVDVVGLGKKFHLRFGKSMKDVSPANVSFSVEVTARQ